MVNKITLLIFLLVASPAYAADVGCGRDTDRSGAVDRFCPTPDADKDGENSISGGGTDCDDNDSSVFSGIAKVGSGADTFKLCTAGTFGADNAAFDPTDAQILTIIGVVNLASASRFAFNDNSVHYVGSLAIPVKSVPGTGGNVYGVLVARGAFTAAASTDVTVTLGIAQD